MAVQHTYLRQLRGAAGGSRQDLGRGSPVVKGLYRTLNITKMPRLGASTGAPLSLASKVVTM